MVIASGAADGVVRRVMEGEPLGTLFPARESHLRVRKSWLAFGKRIMGDIVVDEGCEKALLNQGSSILAAGIMDAEGEFKAGNTVRVLSPDGREIARGIVNYAVEDLKKILGRQTNEFSALLEGEIYEEVIHRDNMVLMV